MVWGWWVALWVICVTAAAAVGWVYGYDHGWDRGSEMERWLIERDQTWDEDDELGSPFPDDEPPPHPHDGVEGGDEPGD